LTSHWLSLTAFVWLQRPGCPGSSHTLRQRAVNVDNPYVGMSLLYLILPVVFFTGLALIPSAPPCRARRIASGLAQAPDRRRRFDGWCVFRVSPTAANFVIGSQLVYRADRSHGNAPVLRPELPRHAAEARRAPARGAQERVLRRMPRGSRRFGLGALEVNGTRQLMK
jgi:hypothetical protein